MEWQAYQKEILAMGLLRDQIGKWNYGQSKQDDFNSVAVSADARPQPEAAVSRQARSAPCGRDRRRRQHGASDRAAARQHQVGSQQECAGHGLAP